MQEPTHYMCCNIVDVIEDGQTRSMSVDDFASGHPSVHPTSVVHDTKECRLKYYRFTAGDDDNLYNLLVDSYVLQEGR
jgi:hypothetical protein